MSRHCPFKGGVHPRAPVQGGGSPPQVRGQRLFRLLQQRPQGRRHRQRQGGGRRLRPRGILSGRPGRDPYRGFFKVRRVKFYRVLN